MQRCVKNSSQFIDYFSSFMGTNIRKLNFYIYNFFMANTHPMYINCTDIFISVLLISITYFHLNLEYDFTLVKIFV